MTKVTVELKNKAVKAPVEIKQGQYVEIDGSIYVCAFVDIGGVEHSQLTNIEIGTCWNAPQKGDTYKYQSQHPIRFIDKIKITEE